MKSTRIKLCEVSTEVILGPFPFQPVAAKEKRHMSPPKSTKKKPWYFRQTKTTKNFYFKKIINKDVLFIPKKTNFTSQKFPTLPNKPSPTFVPNSQALPLILVLRLRQVRRALKQEPQGTEGQHGIEERSKPHHLRMKQPPAVGNSSHGVSKTRGKIIGSVCFWVRKKRKW